MGLEFPHRWEHALLADVVAEANAANPGVFLGRTAIQKILYFCRVLVVPMTYDFEIYHFGPFCSEVLSDMDWLLADEVLVDNSSQARYSNYRPGTNWPELKRQFREELDRYAEKIRSVAAALSPLSPDNLELLATLDYCFRWVRAGGGAGPWRDRATQRFMMVKKDKFEASRVNSSYDLLVRAGLIEP